MAGYGTREWNCRWVHIARQNFLPEGCSGCRTSVAPSHRSGLRRCAYMVRLQDFPCSIRSVGQQLRQRSVGLAREKLNRSINCGCRTLMAPHLPMAANFLGAALLHSFGCSVKHLGQTQTWLEGRTPSLEKNNVSWMMNAMFIYKQWIWKRI